MPRNNLHLRFHDAVRHLHPNASSIVDYRVRDDLDGNGPFVDHWGLPGKPPTYDEVAALIPQIDAAKKEPTKEEKLDQLLGSHGLTRDDLKNMLKDKQGEVK